MLRCHGSTAPNQPALPTHSPTHPHRQLWSWKFEAGQYRVASLAETSATSTESNAVQVRPGALGEVGEGVLNGSTGPLASAQEREEERERV